MKQDRLFEAIGEIDADLVQRSNQPYRRNRKPFTALAACACLVLVSSIGVIRYRQYTTETPDKQSNPAASDIMPPMRSDSDSDATSDFDSVLQLNGAQVGELHLCQLQDSVLSEAPPLPAFAINVNREIYTTAEEAGAYVIQPKIAPAQEDMPPVRFTIQHQPDTAPTEAMQSKADAFAEEFAEVSAITQTTQGFYLTAGNGTDWNAAQVKLWVVSDAKDGCFLLTARYYTEAEEGHGVRFHDMAETFQVVPPEMKIPEWMRLLYRTSDQLLSAIFSNQLDTIADLVNLGDSGFLSGYGEDVSSDICIAAIDYTIEYSEGEPYPSAAIVSVKHRIHLEDSFNYLTMELRYQKGQWLLCSAGIEK